MPAYSKDYVRLGQAPYVALGRRAIIRCCCSSGRKLLIMQEIVILAVVMLLGMGAYWSMVIFPKQRDFQKRQRFARELVAGDEVITGGGLIGRVVALEEGVAYIEIADGLVVRMIAASLLAPFEPELLAENARKGMSDETPILNEREG